MTVRINIFLLAGNTLEALRLIYINAGKEMPPLGKNILKDSHLIIKRFMIALQALQDKYSRANEQKCLAIVNNGMDVLNKLKASIRPNLRLGIFNVKI